MIAPLGSGHVIAALSLWIDRHPSNIDRDPEALMWHRVMKVAEEVGEVTEIMIGVSGGNPRKGHSHDASDLIPELLDVALAALAAVEHVTGNTGASLQMLEAKIDKVAKRAGILESW